MSYCKYCGSDTATLRAQAQMLEAREMEVQELREALRREGLRTFPDEWKLTPAEGIVFSLLLTRETCSKAELLHAYTEVKRARDPHFVAPEPKIIDVFVCKLRRKLEPIGLTILTIWGQGYRLPRAEAAAVVEKLEAAA